MQSGSASASHEIPLTFLWDRVQFYLRDELGFSYDVVNAVLLADPDNVVDAVARAQAVSKVRGSADFESISVAFKRMKNILRQAEENNRRIGSTLESGALTDEAEKELAASIPGTAAAVESLRATHNYTQALLEIAKLRPAVDKFFDKVMVMVEEDNLRANRLALLQTLVKEFSTIADFSEIVTEGKESTK
jgi:glycyl-tRNA synthetase beta chain